MKVVDKALAYLFAHTKADESIETILGGVLEHINRLQELSKAYDETAAAHTRIAEASMGKANELEEKAETANTLAVKLRKVVG